MRKYFILLISLFWCSIQIIQAQYVSEIVEYQPAPGQLINIESIGSPQAAESIIGHTNGLVSLGAFGGYIIVKMDQAIENDPGNPFGVDFSVFGNSLNDWCEAGAVYVMKDENGNGIPDEEWFLLAGSDYYWSDSYSNYYLHYFNPQQAQMNIPWVDQNQDSGFVFSNSIHQQEYYPSSSYFPNIDEHSQFYQAPLIQGDMDFSEPGLVRSYERAFGYADNHPRGSAPYHIPDNPYTLEKENAGGDAFDISWARNANGDLVSLDKIHFIKIATAMNQSGGHLGEISTEITGIIDTEANANLQGEMQLLLMKDIPEKVLIQSQIQMEAIHFNRGIPLTTQELSWTVSNENLAQISEEGMLNTSEAGELSVFCSVSNQPEIFSSQRVKIIKPGSITFLEDYSQIHLNENRVVKADIKDQNGDHMNQLSLIWMSSDPSILSLESKTESVKIHAESEGECYLKAQVLGFEELQDSILVSVLAPSEKRKVYITVKNETQTIIPRHSIWVENFDLNPFVKDAHNEYHFDEISDITVAHAIAQLFINKDLSTEMAFKDEAINTGLFLWKIPLEEDHSLEYIYGYGGETTVPYNRSWIIKVNEQNMVHELEEQVLSNEDEILIYHIADINQDWTLTQLKGDHDTLILHEELSIQLKEYRYEWNESEVLLNSESFVSGQNIYLNQSPFIQDEEWLYTNVLGQANLKMESLGQQVIGVGMDEIQVFVKNATSIKEMTPLAIKLYPNPVVDGKINIEFQNGKDVKSIRIYNAIGQLVLESTPKSSLDVHTLKPGFYFLLIIGDRQQHSQSFLLR